MNLILMRLKEIQELLPTSNESSISDARAQDKCNRLLNDLIEDIEQGIKLAEENEDDRF